MITEYPLEHRRYDRPEYEPLWAAAAALGLPLSLHTAHATAGQDPRRRRGDAARRLQPRHQGVLSGAVDVRPDLLRRLRASSPASRWPSWNSSWRGVPHVLSHHGLHLP